MTLFGPAGNSESFYNEGNKSTIQAPAWLSKIGLDAYEYQCGKGVKTGKETALKIGSEAHKYKIHLSIHAPYYISFASDEEDKRKRSIGYVMETLQLAKWLDAKRIVVHTGSCSKTSREAALKMAIDGLRQTISEADSQGFGDISICPEVLGKFNQLGTLDEIIEMCKIDERLIPTIDFGHLHARGLGSMKTKQDFEYVLDKINNELGSYRGKYFHAHFSRIEYTASGGEKKHWTYDDVEYGPDFDPLAEILVERDLSPIIICESRDNIAEDALKLKNIYLKLKEKMK